MSSIPTTMRAAVYRPGNLNLVLETDFPVPQPATGQVLLKIAACGTCHSDIFTLSNTLIENRTFIMGHETAGTAVKYVAFSPYLGPDAEFGLQARRQCHRDHPRKSVCRARNPALCYGPPADLEQRRHRHEWRIC